MGLGADMERMEHDDRPTYGEGLAANAVLPAKLAELLAARAEVLKRHTRALELTNAAAQKELDAYTSLERAHRDVASELADLAEEMASYRNLPMGRHDMTEMTDPKDERARARLLGWGSGDVAHLAARWLQGFRRFENCREGSLAP